MTVTFYGPAFPSRMWSEGEGTRLHAFRGVGRRGVLARLFGRA